MTIKELYDWAKENDCVNADIHFMDVEFLVWSDPVNIEKEGPNFVTIGIKGDEVVGEDGLPLQ